MTMLYGTVFFGGPCVAYKHLRPIVQGYVPPPDFLFPSLLSVLKLRFAEH